MATARGPARAAKVIAKRGLSQPNPAPFVAAGEIPLLFLDANILLTQYVRSVFLDIADAGLCRVYWSDQVLAEVRRNLLKPKYGKTSVDIDRLFNDMQQAFPDALVQGWQQYEPQFADKTDDKDAHVAAGALKLSKDVYGGQQTVLVTSNITHLPQTAFAGSQIRSGKPGTVLKDLLAAQPSVADVLVRMLERFRRPQVTRQDLLDVLDRSQCGVFATALGEAWGFRSER